MPFSEICNRFKELQKLLPLLVVCFVALFDLADLGVAAAAEFTGAGPQEGAG